MRSIFLAGLIGGVWLALMPMAVLAQTSRPGAAGAFPGVDRLRASLESLDLSDDQKVQINSLIDEAKNRIAEMRQQGGQTPEQTRQVMQDIRQKLVTILTPAQLQELREKMQQNLPGRVGAGRNGPATRPAGAAARAGGAGRVGQNVSEPQSAASAQAPTEMPKVLEAGQVAPDFRLSTLDGSIVRLSSLKGRVVTLVFGSYSSPMLRDRVAGLNQLTLQEETRAEIYLVYTREMHPAGGWESDRNQLDHVTVQQPKTIEEKLAAARQYRALLHLNMPVLVDDLQDSTTTAYGAFPDGAVVINRDGTIGGSQQWADPTVLRRMIDQATATAFHAGGQ